MGDGQPMLDGSGHNAKGGEGLHKMSCSFDKLLGFFQPLVIKFDVVLDNLLFCQWFRLAGVAESGALFCSESSWGWTLPVSCPGKGMALNKGAPLSSQEKRENSDDLRMAVRETICDNGDERYQYDEALIAIIVDEPLRRYCQRIRSPDFWGGDTELLHVFVYISEHEVLHDNLELILDFKHACKVGIFSFWPPSSSFKLTARSKDRQSQSPDN